MDAETAKRIMGVNLQFYQTFAEAFSATRRRLQPGVRRLVERIPADAHLLDLGCGNGELEHELARRGHRGRYLGVDFSIPLLEYATPLDNPDGACFLEFDLSSPDWSPVQARAPFSLAVAFAVLHHIPSQVLRLQILRKIHTCLEAGGLFFHSNWQFLNSPRLSARIQPWERAGLNAALVDPGDYLLDWREGGEGLRYVHHFSESELDDLTSQCGFTVQESFLSDGEGGNLGLYQIWKALPEL